MESGVAPSGASVGHNRPLSDHEGHGGHETDTPAESDAGENAHPEHAHGDGATPTEAGALGAGGAIGLAAANGRLSLEALRETMDETMRLTSMVMFLLVGSTAFSLIFRGLGGDFWIEGLLTNLPGGVIGFLLVANLTIFLLGFFIDFFEIAFIIIPLLKAPAAQLLPPEFGATADAALVWFGVMVGMNLQTSFLTPPFGFALFYLRGVAPDSVATTQIYRGAVPFIAIQVVGLLLLMLYPELVTWAL